MADLYSINTPFLELYYNYKNRRNLLRINEFIAQKASVGVKIMLQEILSVS